MIIQRAAPAAAFLLCLIPWTMPFAAITSPSQPTSGPGGSAYSHDDVTINTYGTGNDQYWIFEPAQPAPASAPVIAFLHGYAVLDTTAYEPWFRHLARRGNIVIYPKYQEDLSTFSIGYTRNAIKATRDALAELRSGPHVSPDESRFAIAGHSAGGMVAANMAAQAASEGLPVPKALITMMPGLNQTIPLSDLTTIPSTALQLSVVGEEDNVAGDASGRKIYLNTTQIPQENKNYIIARADAHGVPALRTDHGSPTSAPLDAIDYYGFWKLLDGLTDAAFYGRNREFALGNTFQQRFMGFWSDGVPVKELSVMDIPPQEESPCDLNLDAEIDVADLQMLANAVLAESTEGVYDLNGDVLINVQDIQVLINVILAQAACPA